VRSWGYTFRLLPMVGVGYYWIQCRVGYYLSEVGQAVTSDSPYPTFARNCATDLSERRSMSVERSSTREMIQCLRRLPNSAQLAETIPRIIAAYKTGNEPWIVGYSGGKDSTAVVKLVFQSLLRIRDRPKPVTVIYCDTGVEIPMASALARKALRGLVRESRAFGLPICARVLSPPLTERFFVKVIGRGYPPPTDKFRWCTDRLRIDPVSRFLESEKLRSATVVLGVRESESPTRHLTLKENRTHNRFWRKQRGERNRHLFLPIVDYSIHDVWLVNLLVDRPRTLRAKEVADLYAEASAECPAVRDVKGAPCGKARFGCWTCTVAKNGVTLRNLISHGEHRLEPLLQFRLWMEKERSQPNNRWPRRRNGKPGLGPMTLEWRRVALNELLKAQEQSGLNLIGPEEILAIHREWAADDAR
jgi:DNA sulfur modification protein DndC